MKKRVFILAAIMLLGLGGKAVAQMDDCAVTLSLFAEPAKTKNYNAALPHYEKLIKECPKYHISIYQYGEKMFKHFIDEGDNSKIPAYIQNFELRLENYPAKTKEGEVLSKIAQLKYDNSIGSKMEQFKAFDKAYKTDPDNFTSPKSIYTYFSLAVDLYDAGEKEIQEVFDMYDEVTEKIEDEEGQLAEKLTQLIDKQENGTDLSAKEKRLVNAYETNLGAYSKVKSSVNGKLGILADCENLIPLYEKLFEEKKNDVNWLKSAAGRLNAKDCETPMFYQMVQQLHSLEPSASSAFYLGRLAERDGKAGEALDYYNQAVELESDPNQKVRYYRSIAENFRDKGQYGKARTYYRKLLEIKPNDGNSYLKIANMYAKSANNCGSGVFEKRAMYWLAAQMADKAARVDPSIAGTANQTASSYRGLAPSKSDIFSAGMAGKTVSFSCWVGGSVRVPNL